MSEASLTALHRCTRQWFRRAFAGATRAQELSWAPISRGESTLLLAPTGSGKTLAAFLVAIDRLLFARQKTTEEKEPAAKARGRRGKGRSSKKEGKGVRVLYVSPLKALAVDVERNLRAPLAGIRAEAERSGVSYAPITVGIRSGDTTPRERARMKRTPPDILITTPESLYLLLTSQAAEGPRTVDTVIIDEIHSLVPTKRGCHLALSLERLEALRRPQPVSSEASDSKTSVAKLVAPDAVQSPRPTLQRPSLQRIGLSATQRPLDEVARYLGGYEKGAPRPVQIIDAGSDKKFDLRIEVPVDDMARLKREEAVAAADSPSNASSPDASISDATLRDTALSKDAQQEAALTPLEEELAALSKSQASGGGAGSTSIWPAIHPELVRLIRSHRSTMIFANSRRLSERLAGAINELAGEELALSHHGSIAKDMRAQIEERLKRGELPAIVATSSLELGIDIGAVDLVVQIEAPLSVASGIQRIGRAGHQVGAVSAGIIFPKYRGDLLACAAVTDHIQRGLVESTHYPRNAIDVLAQQLVAMVSNAEDAQPELQHEESLFRLVRQAAPYAELARTSFDNVLDMLTGRYPSEQFGELRARLNWDRIAGTVTPRRGAKMLAIANAGTIPDRGLYGVFLAGAERPVRVGELDEEMVFESREGEVFLLGASAWRIEEITHDRVLVSPAPGEPGRMPFWHGDRPGRPADFGRAIGALTRALLPMKEKEATARLQSHHGLATVAARNLLAYLQDQQEATGQVPNDECIVIERFHDEIGDLCVAILSPFGGRVHTPWATAVRARLLEEHGVEADIIPGDDGIIFRMVESDAPPPDALFFPDPDDLTRLLTNHLSDTALFAARFRENAGRALLLPRRRPGQRTPLWAQRRKSAGLLQVAAEFSDFPIVLETYRECLQDVFDLPALLTILKDIQARRIHVHSLETRRPSPFASALMFNYVATFMYEGDAPLAERRAQALSLDHARLRALLGEPEMRQLLDPDAVRQVEFELSRRAYRLRDAEDIVDRLRALGDLRVDELTQASAPTSPKEEVADSESVDPVQPSEHAAGTASAESSPPDEHWSDPPAIESWLDELIAQRRVLKVSVGGEERYTALEDAARYRDALGVVPPPWTPHALLMPVDDALTQLVARYARNHGPFRAQELADRLGLGVATVEAPLRLLVESGRLLHGELLPEKLLHERALGPGKEFCDREVWSWIKRRTLALLRQKIEAVPSSVYARFLAQHGKLIRIGGAGRSGGNRSGIDRVDAVLNQLEGTPLIAGDLESRILPARVEKYDRRDLDELLASGDYVWRGIAPLGEKNGRIAFYSVDHYSLLAPPPDEVDDPLAEQLLTLLAGGGAMFFRQLARETGRLPSDVLRTLWDLVWAGRVTNDTLAPLRSLMVPKATANRMRRRRRNVQGRTPPLPGSEGRWSLLPTVDGDRDREARVKGLVHNMLARDGIVTREALVRLAKDHPDLSHFGHLYPVLKAMEELGQVRRGYFVAGLGATQFALPGADDRLRDHRKTGASTGEDAPFSHRLILAADDPANPYGAHLPWPGREDDGEKEPAETRTAKQGVRPSRSAGARVVIIDGTLVAFVGRTGKRLTTFLPDDEVARLPIARALAETLKDESLMERGRHGGGAVVFARIDGQSASKAPFGETLRAAGFVPAAGELFYRRPRPTSP